MNEGQAGVVERCSVRGERGEGIKRMENEVEGEGL